MINKPGGSQQAPQPKPVSHQATPGASSDAGQLSSAQVQDPLPPRLAETPVPELPQVNHGEPPPLPLSMPGALPMYRPSDTDLQAGALRTINANYELWKGAKRGSMSTKDELALLYACLNKQFEAIGRQSTIPKRMLEMAERVCELLVAEYPRDPKDAGQPGKVKIGRIKGANGDSHDHFELQGRSRLTHEGVSKLYAVIEMFIKPCHAQLRAGAPYSVYCTDHFILGLGEPLANYSAFEAQALVLRARNPRSSESLSSAESQLDNHAASIAKRYLKQSVGIPSAPLDIASFLTGPAEKLTYEQSKQWADRVTTELLNKLHQHGGANYPDFRLELETVCSAHADLREYAEHVVNEDERSLARTLLDECKLPWPVPKEVFCSLLKLVDKRVEFLRSRAAFCMLLRLADTREAILSSLRLDLHQRDVLLAREVSISYSIDSSSNTYTHRHLGAAKTVTCASGMRSVGVYRFGDHVHLHVFNAGATHDGAAVSHG